jgi:hypothetical protein
MTYANIRDSVYEIEPWAEEPSQIPDKFLTSQNFAKTSITSKPGFKKQPQLQVATNTVYFIKHNEEEHALQSKSKLRYHHTTEGSPKFMPQHKAKGPTHRAVELKGSNATHSSSKLLKPR